MDWLKKLFRKPATVNVQSNVLLPAVLSGLALWAAFAPLNWSLLAWFAPLGWLIVVDRPEPVGRGGYFALWISGCLFWLLILHGIRLAFWPLVFGWLALSLYVAAYVPLFIATARIMLHRWRIPLMVAAPVAWIGMEIIRSYALTGFPSNVLAHTQASSPLLIQSADQLGTAGIAWVMISVAVAILKVAQWWTQRSLRAVVPSLINAMVLILAMIGYGIWRLQQAEDLAKQPPILRAMLVQENTPSIFEYNPERGREAWQRYVELTRQGAAIHAPVDLIVWPESTFTANAPLMENKLTRGVPPEVSEQGYDQAQVAMLIEEYRHAFSIRTQVVLNAASAVSSTNDNTNLATPHLLVGCDYNVFTSEEVNRYNAAILVSPNGQPVDVYNKVHLVMFGEYIPLGSLLSWLGDLVGFGGADAGNEVKSFQVNEIRVAPNICFESVIPHLISRQVRTLVQRDESPDVLCNLTNDSWFRGSSMLEHHLASTIFVAVENRRPMLVAANTGLTAQIDGSGRLLQVTERMTPATILAEVRRDGRSGLVQMIGYPLAWTCGLLSVSVWIIAIGERFMRRKPIPLRSGA